MEANTLCCWQQINTLILHSSWDFNLRDLRDHLVQASYLEGFLVFFLARSRQTWLDGKESTCSVGDLGSIPGWGRSPGEGNGYPLQYSCLENPMDRGAWRAVQSMGSLRVGHD